MIDVPAPAGKIWQRRHNVHNKGEIMKKRHIWDLVLALLWFCIAIINLVLFFADVPVSGLDVFYPSICCFGFFIDKVFNEIKKK